MSVCMHVIYAHTKCTFAVCLRPGRLVVCVCASECEHSHPLILCAHPTSFMHIQIYTPNACVRANVTHIGRTFVTYRHVLYWAILFSFSFAVCSMNKCARVRERAPLSEPNQPNSQPASQETYKPCHVYMCYDLTMAMAIGSVRLCALLLWLCNMCECMHIKCVLETIVKINVMNNDEEEEEEEQQEEVVVVKK